MIFVWSVWWIVIAILVVGIIGTAVAFIMMDRKDFVLINDFKKAHMPVTNSEPNIETAKKD